MFAFWGILPEISFESFTVSDHITVPHLNNMTAEARQALGEGFFRCYIQDRRDRNIARVQKRLMSSRWLKWFISVDTRRISVSDSAEGLDHSPFNSLEWLPMGWEKDAKVDCEILIALQSYKLQDWRTSRCEHRVNSFPYMESTIDAWMDSSV